MLVSTTQVRIYVWNAASTYLATSNLSSTVPGSWSGASNDWIRWNATIPGTMV